MHAVPSSMTALQYGQRGASSAVGLGMPSDPNVQVTIAVHSRQWKTAT